MEKRKEKKHYRFIGDHVGAEQEPITALSILIFHILFCFGYDLSFSFPLYHLYKQQQETLFFYYENQISESHYLIF